MALIANWVYRTATNFEATAEQTRKEVEALCAKFPLYQ